MRRHRHLTLLATALCTVGLLLAGCGGDDEATDTTDTTTTTTTTAGSDATETTEGAETTAPAEEETPAEPAEATPVDCSAFSLLASTFSGYEEIVIGDNETQVAADAAIDEAVSGLAGAAAGDPELEDALELVGEWTFQVSETPTGPTIEEVDAALVTLEGAWEAECAAQPLECPSPETLEAEGLQCDSEGNVTPIEEGLPFECPDPDTLAEEGFTCDDFGNLTPIPGHDGAVDPDETEIPPLECPAPETLEAEGLQCDPEGNVTPIDGEG